MPIEIVAKRKKDAPEVKRGEKPIPMNKIPKKEKEKEKIKEGGLGDLAQRAEMELVRAVPTERCPRLVARCFQ